MAERLGIDLNEYGFAEAGDLPPHRDLAARHFRGRRIQRAQGYPRNGDRSQLRGSPGLALLAPARGSLTRQAVYPPERT
jgi:hypothetical protein